MQENYELIQKGFRILLPHLAGYIGQEMSRVYKTAWWQEVLIALSDQYDLPSEGSYGDLLDSLDIANCLRLIDRRWREVFSGKLTKSHRNWASELMGVRNAAAHIGMNDFEQGYTERALDTMALLCESIDSEGTEELRALYRKVRYGSEAGSASSVPAGETPAAGKAKTIAAVLGNHVGENLPSWRDIMQPHPDVAEGRYKSAEFAADLAQVARGEGAYEYRDPVEFFARTYVTEGMAGLLAESLQRLSGTGGEPVIQLKTAFGGGKTHSMLALYHIAHSRMSLESVPALKPVMERAGLEEFPHANVAVLVGTALDPSRRKKPANLPGYSVSTIWGEMAYQLVTSAGKPELYAKYIRDADLRGVAPGSENLKNLFNECGPCLILMDELVAYAKVLFGAQGLPAGSFDNFITFIQQITEAARASENSIVVASIPESSIEIGGEAGQKALEAIEHTFGRMESIWKPVAANEGFEVVRRRLFLDCKDEGARDAVCDAFSRMYQENSEDFPLESKEVEYRDRLVSCYPIHPEVFDRLYGDWATLEKFQRTRGVLRLMAAVIHELWMANDEGAMIMPGSITLDMPQVRDELVRHLPETWNSIIDREVDGKDSIPYQKDKANIRYGRILACRRVARTVMLGSAPSTSALRDQGVRGLETSRVLLGVVQPGENIADFKDALNTLHGSLSYLYNNPNGSRFWYDTKPTLRKTAEDRASQVSLADVDMEIESRLKKCRKENTFAGIHPAPASSGDVPDDQAVRLVLLRTNDTYRRNYDGSPAMKAVQDILNNRGTSPRIFRNMLAFVAPDESKLGALRQEVKRCIAWTSIVTDKDDLNLDGQQSREAENNLKRSNDTVELRLKETYCWLMVPSIDQYGDMKDIQWEISDLGGGPDSIVAKAARKMLQSDQIIPKWAPALLQSTLDDLLWKDSENIPVKKLWEQLCTYCYLPRLANYSVLQATICQGCASNEYFGIAAAYNGGRYVDLKWNQPVLSFNDTDLLVKPAAAKAQLKKESEIPAVPAVNVNQAGSGGAAAGITSGGGGAGGAGAAAPAVTNKHFYMSADVDTVRVNKVISTYVDEIIRHLMQVEGANVQLKLEVEVNAPNGIPSTTVRTVSENCRTLKIKDFGFDD